MKKVNLHRMRFVSQATYPMRVVTLPVYIGEGYKALTLKVTFIVVDAPT